MLAQGEVGAMIQSDPMMQQMLQADPEGAEIKISGMIAQRVAELTIELAQSEAMGQQTRSFSMLKTKRTRFKSFRLTKKSRARYEL